VSRKFDIDRTTDVVSHFDEITAEDFRESRPFAEFCVQVLEAVRSAPGATFRALKQRFADEYRLTLAIDDLIATRLIERRSQGVFITRFFPAEKQG